MGALELGVDADLVQGRAALELLEVKLVEDFHRVEVPGHSRFYLVDVGGRTFA